MTSGSMGMRRCRTGGILVNPVSTADLPRFVIANETTTTSFALLVPSGSSEFFQPPKRMARNHWSNRVNNWLVSQAGERACKQILDEVKSQLVDPRKGFLVRINAERDAMENLRPGPGAIATPIGPGRDPLSVLAEDYRKPQLGPAPTPGFRDASWYCWISTGADGTLVADRYSQEATSGIETNARVEAERLDVLGEFLTDVPARAIYRAQRAEYWQEVKERNFKLDRSREDYLRLDRLNKEMESAQDQFNAAYENYQQTIAELARQQRQEAMLDRIGLVLQLIETGVGIAAASEARAAQQAQNRATQDRLDQLADRHAIQTIEMRDTIERVENQLNRLWRQWLVTPPAADPVPRFRREGRRLVPDPA